MKRKHLIGLFLFAALALSGCGSDGRYQVTLITEGRHTLYGPVAGDLVILGGEVSLEPEASLEGSVHLFSGELSISGVVRGDVAFLNGTLVLEPGAEIHGDLNYGGGVLSGLETGVVSGRVNTGTGIQIPAAPQQPQRSGWQVVRWVVGAFLIAGLAVPVGRYFPQPLGRVREALVQHALVSAAMGILVGVVGLSLVVLLAYTILLIPVALLGVGFMGLAIVYGWIAGGTALGAWAVGLSRLQMRPGTERFLGTFALMLVLNALSAIPGIGGMLGILMGVVGLGAVFLTRFGLRRFIPEA